METNPHFRVKIQNAVTFSCNAAENCCLDGVFWRLFVARWCHEFSTRVPMRKHPWEHFFFRFFVLQNPQYRAESRLVNTFRGGVPVTLFLFADAAGR